MARTSLPINLEMAATEEMLEIALRHRPHAACIVPEKREERTTEGGLDAAGLHNQLAPIVARLNDAGIRVSLFIEPDARQIDAAIRLNAPVVELHTQAATRIARRRTATELRSIDAAASPRAMRIEPCQASGSSSTNVGPIAAIPQLRELNIGHSSYGDLHRL